MHKTLPAAVAVPTAGLGGKLSTNEMASRLRIAGQSVRASLCRNGHYLGMRPVKLPNGKLLWDAYQVERLVSGEAS